MRRGNPVPPGLSAGGGSKPANTTRRRSGGRVPPGLSAGGGLKRQRDRAGPRLPVCSPRPQRRGRIETPQLVIRPILGRVPPGLSAGGGLKQVLIQEAITVLPFPPASARGRIETRRDYSGVSTGLRSPRPQRRGRIETLRTVMERGRPRCSPQPQRRGRIETGRRCGRNV